MIDLNKSNSVCYLLSNGKKYPDNVKEGNGVKVGETVEMIVDRNDKTIEWLVDGKRRASSIVNILEEKGKRFFPYVQMFDK